MPDIKFRMVNDEALPTTHQWALIDDHRGQVTAVVKCSAFGPQVVAEALAAYRMLCEPDGAVLRAG